MSDTPIDPTFPADEDVKINGDVESEAPAPEDKAPEPAAAEPSEGVDAEGDAAEPTAEEPVADEAADAAGADEAAADVAPEAVEGADAAPSEAAEATDPEVAPIADDGNVVHPEAIQDPLAEASAIAPEMPSASTGPVSDEAGEGTDADASSTEGDEASDEVAQPVPATPAPLDTIRAGAQSTADGDADPSAGIVSQPSPEDALAERPLSGIASEENRGAVDAMPAAAQQHMGQWIKGVHEAEPAEAGQLPTTSDLPGTPLDATGLGTYAQGGVTQADKALEVKAAAGDEQAQAIVDKSTGGQSDGGEDTELSDGSLEDDGEGVDFGDASGDEDVDSDSDGYFGEVLVQHEPLKDVAGEAIDALKEAAEQAAVAQNHFQSVPLAVLDVQHKDLLSDMRVVLGDLLRLSARLFERLER